MIILFLIVFLVLWIACAIAGLFILRRQESIDAESVSAFLVIGPFCLLFMAFDAISERIADWFDK